MSEIRAAVAALGPGSCKRRRYAAISIHCSRGSCKRQAGVSISPTIPSGVHSIVWLRTSRRAGVLVCGDRRAWTEWLTEMAMFRSRVATLIHAQGPHCIVPKASAGQGLRAVLNCHDEQLRVIATRNEFSSIDLILKAYAARGRIRIDWVKPHADRRYQSGRLRQGTACRGRSARYINGVF